MTRLLGAVAFLSRVPVRRSFEAADVGRSAIFFPLVGAAIGLVQLGAFLLLEPRVPRPLLAAGIVALSTWLTRAIHLDGLADFADGLGGGRTPDEALRIMRDPRIGAFGAVALVLVIAAKIAAIASLSSAFVLVVAPALGRWSSVALGSLLPSAREGEGLGASFASGAGRLELLGATATAVALSFLLPLTPALVLWSAVLSVTVLCGAIARRRIGGVTGDVLGANVELSETLALAAGAC